MRVKYSEIFPGQNQGVVGDLNVYGKCYSHADLRAAAFTYVIARTKSKTVLADLPV